jgi:dihydroxyacetone kinase-like protein
MTETINFKLFKKIILNIYDTISKNKIHLSKLDSVIGDGDHGISITKGLKSAIDKIEKTDPSNISDLLNTTGSAITETIGGVTGPIFGMFFSEMAKPINKDKTSIDLEDLKNMFSGSLDKVMKVGGAKPGDKTMVDALNPAVAALLDLENNDLKQALYIMTEAAKTGAESTKDMIAKKGRARYSGERSLGYEDAGANTIYFILKTFYESI